MKSKLIIIEGADRVGKTTLAKGLADKLGYLWVKFGEANDEANKFTRYIDLISYNEPGLVLDRSWLSSAFYDIYRRGKPWVYFGAFEPRDRYSYLMAFLSTYFDMVYLNILRPWELAKPAHEAEIRKGLKVTKGESQVVLSLEDRKLEHDAFVITPNFLGFTNLYGHVFNLFNLDTEEDLLIKALTMLDKLPK